MRKCQNYHFQCTSRKIDRPTVLSFYFDGYARREIFEQCEQFFQMGFGKINGVFRRQTFVSLI